jgi:hypothetical protein
MVRKGGNMRSLRSLVIAVLVLCPGVRLGAQAPSAAPSDHVAAIKESLQKSMAELREYQWVQTTVISIKGEEKSRTQDSCYYGADGSLQKTPIPNEPESQAKEPRGIRGKIVEHKQEDISDSAKQAVALVKEYVPPDPARIQAAKEAGNLSVVPPDSQGGAKVVIRNYLKTGDSITLDFNTSVNRITGLSVSTYADESKDTVTLTASFGIFPDGTVYAQTIDLDVKAQELAVQITNSGYKKMAS